MGLTPRTAGVVVRLNLGTAMRGFLFPSMHNEHLLGVAEHLFAANEAYPNDNGCGGAAELGHGSEGLLEQGTNGLRCCLGVILEGGKAGLELRKRAETQERVEQVRMYVKM